MIEQEKIDEEDKLQRTVRMTVAEYEAVVGRCGGIQAGWDKLVKEARGQTEWLPDLPKRLVAAYTSIRDIARIRENQVVDSKKMREVIMSACNCTRRTAVNHLHELKDRRLLYTFGFAGDEFMHYVACTLEDQEKVKKCYERQVI